MLINNLPPNKAVAAQLERFLTTKKERMTATVRPTEHGGGCVKVKDKRYGFNYRIYLVNGQYAADVADIKVLTSDY